MSTKQRVTRIRREVKRKVGLTLEPLTAEGVSEWRRDKERSVLRL